MYVYILSNKPHGIIYIGVTNDLIRRVYEHKQKICQGFTSRYNVSQLVYFEVFEDERNAIEREKQLKHWKRTWKTKLIEENNPDWIDLYSKIIG